MRRRLKRGTPIGTRSASAGKVRGFTRRNDGERGLISKLPVILIDSVARWNNATPCIFPLVSPALFHAPRFTVSLSNPPRSRQTKLFDRVRLTNSKLVSPSMLDCSALISWTRRDRSAPRCVRRLAVERNENSLRRRYERESDSLIGTVR